MGSDSLTSQEVIGNEDIHGATLPNVPINKLKYKKKNVNTSWWFTTRDLNLGLVKCTFVTHILNAKPWACLLRCFQIRTTAGEPSGAPGHKTTKL